MLKTISKLKFMTPCGMDEVRRWVRRWNARDQRCKCAFFGLDYTSVRERSSILMEAEPGMPEWQADRLALRYEIEAMGIRFDREISEWWDKSWFHQLIVSMGIERRMKLRSIRRSGRAVRGKRSGTKGAA